MIDYEVEQVEAVLGSQQVFLRVRYWYDRARQGEPDMVHDFRLSAVTQRAVPVLDRMGFRRTMSGKFVPTSREVDGEWVPWGPGGPPDDPWKDDLVDVDPIAELLPTIERVGNALRTRGHKGRDVFQRGEILLDERRPRKPDHPATKVAAAMRGKGKDDLRTAVGLPAAEPPPAPPVKPPRPTPPAPPTPTPKGKNT